MAILTKGIFGPVSGQIGNLVFCICVDGTNYVRSRPRKTKAKPSKAQLAQRAKFGITAKFLQPLSAILKKGYHKKYKKKGITAMGLAKSAMLRSGIIAEGDTLRIDFPNIKLSDGTLHQLMGLEMRATGRKGILLEWKCELNRFNSFADDQVQLIVYHLREERFLFSEIGHREDEAIMIKLASANPEDRFVVYVFTESIAENTCAQYVGEVGV